ncbi:MAG: hypothetical protein V4592_02830 [Bacteroidota bacterium]
MKTSLKYILIVFAAFAIRVSYAQKLPNKQLVNLRANSNMQTDGKATDWNNRFEAFNRSTEVYYSISNDDENIYFIIRAVNEDIVRRIVSGGIKLTFKEPGENTKGKNIQITYPALQQYVNFKLSSRKSEVPDTTAKTADSIKSYNNDLVSKNCKWIKVIGVKNLDTLISIYNTDGIKAYGLFDKKRNYTCEFSISLKNLGLSIEKSNLISYNLQVNGTAPSVHSEIYGKVDDPKKEAILQAFLDNANAKWDQLSSPTYFSGEYILAKKP